MILTDIDIRVQTIHDNLIEPFVAKKTHKGKISYGLSSAGYDLRLANDFQIISKRSVFWQRVKRFGRLPVIDPKNIDPTLFTTVKADHIDLPPFGFALARTFEYVKIPLNCIGILIGKSTYARCAVLLNTTPIEPGWEGFITLEISNLSALPVRVYAYEGIGQLLFNRLTQNCVTPYGSGKYQAQGAEIVHAKVAE